MNGRRIAAIVAGASIWLCAAAAGATPPLDLPFPCGKSYKVSQGHNGGSHTGKSGWAWDFAIPAGHVVTAPADGKVAHTKDDSTRYGCSRSYAGHANYVVLEFGDGTEALFLHLKKGSVRVRPGQRVSRGDPLGEVGRSGYICGVHLHFAIQRSCRSWYCQSIHASFKHAGDPSYPQTVTSKNCGGGGGGRTFCKMPGNASAKVFEEQAECFRRVTQYWWDNGGGHGGHWYHTWATDKPKPETVGWWDFKVEQTGYYDVAVHIPGGAQSRKAKYWIHDGKREHGPYQINQESHSGWKTLKRLNIHAGEAAYVKLPDNTGEKYSRSGRRKVAYDAVRLTRKKKRDWWRDADGDGYGDPGEHKSAFSKPGGYVDNKKDCNDGCKTCHPGADEVCDGEDNDCNGRSDENGMTPYYRDRDGDGWGSEAGSEKGCSPPNGFAMRGGDCDDTRTDVHPTADEITDGADNDCDGEVDEDGGSEGGGDTGVGMGDAGTEGSSGPQLGDPPGEGEQGESEYEPATSGDAGSDAGPTSNVIARSSCSAAGGGAPAGYWALLLIFGALRIFRKCGRGSEG